MLREMLVATIDRFPDVDGPGESLYPAAESSLRDPPQPPYVRHGCARTVPHGGACLGTEIPGTTVSASSDRCCLSVATVTFCPRSIVSNAQDGRALPGASS